MSDILSFAVARATSRAELLETWLSGGTVKVYDGTRPATPDTAITSQALLAPFTLGSPAGTVTLGVWTAEPIASALVSADGSATWARIADSSGAVIADADVGATGSGALMILNNTSLVSGGYVSVVSFTLTEG